MNSTNEHLGIGNQPYYEHDYGNRPPEHYIWLVAEIIKHGKPGNILDLGCGPGLFVEMASKWGLDVTGVDGSTDAIKIAQSRDSSLMLVHCLLSSELPYDDETIDNILLNQVIEHLPASVLAKVLNECRRVLRKSGIIFIYSPNKANKREVQKDPTHINPLLPSELRMALTAAKFEVLAEPNGSRYLRKSFILSKLLSKFMKIYGQEWLSADTNARAKKL
jgi:SAM-dependent methyltransferase